MTSVIVFTRPISRTSAVLYLFSLCAALCQDISANVSMHVKGHSQFGLLIMHGEKNLL